MVLFKNLTGGHMKELIKVVTIAGTCPTVVGEIYTKL